MAYDDSLYRRRDNETTDPAGMTGYRTSQQPGTFADFRDAEPVPLTDTAQRRAVPSAVLDDVFDDPTHGEPGRDRMLIHIVWEALLLAGALVVAYLVRAEAPSSLRGSALDQLMVAAAALGLLALAAGLTMRAGAVNLAVGPVAVAAGLHFAEQGDRGVAGVLAAATLAALALGVVLGLLVVLFHVPGWAASLGAAMGVLVFIERRSAPVDVQGAFEPTNQALFFLAGFAALAILGGLFGTVKAIRRSIGRFRPVADPARRRGTLAAAITAGAIAVSMPLAAVAGVLIAGASTGPVAPTSGFEWTGLAVGAALLGGTSAYGRRGGVFGTVFAVVLITLVLEYATVRGWDVTVPGVAAAAIVLGLLVTRAVETFGRPRSAVGDESWREPAIAPTGRPEQTDSWSSALPAKPVDARTDPWDAQRWNTNGR